MIGEEEKIVQTIATLEDEHKSLDAMIAQIATIDMLQVQRMKKRKLWLKDEIARLQGVLYPDIIA